MRTALILIMVGVPALGAVPGVAVAQASVRLDIPSGYFAVKPASPQKKSAPSGKPSPDGECPTDCLTFDSGYAWAQARRITREQECRGHAKPFVAGCLTFIAEQREKAIVQHQRRSHRRDRPTHRHHKHHHEM